MMDVSLRLFVRELRMLFGALTVPEELDIPGLVTDMSGYLATIVAAVLSIYAVYKVVKLGVRWFGKIGG